MPEYMLLLQYRGNSEEGEYVNTLYIRTKTTVVVIPVTLHWLKDKKREGSRFSFVVNTSRLSYPHNTQL